MGSPLDLAFSPCIYAVECGCLKPQRYCGRFNLLCIPKDEQEEEEGGGGERRRRGNE